MQARNILQCADDMSSASGFAECQPLSDRPWTRSRRTRLPSAAGLVPAVVLGAVTRRQFRSRLSSTPIAPFGRAEIARDGHLTSPFPGSCTVSPTAPRLRPGWGPRPVGQSKARRARGEFAGPGGAGKRAIRKSLTAGLAFARKFLQRQGPQPTLAGGWGAVRPKREVRGRIG